MCAGNRITHIWKSFELFHLVIEECKMLTLLNIIVIGNQSLILIFTLPIDIVPFVCASCQYFYCCVALAKLTMCNGQWIFHFILVLIYRTVLCKSLKEKMEIIHKSRNFSKENEKNNLCFTSFSGWGSTIVKKLETNFSMCIYCVLLKIFRRWTVIEKKDASLNVPNLYLKCNWI